FAAEPNLALVIDFLDAHFNFLARLEHISDALPRVVGNFGNVDQTFKVLRFWEGDEGSPLDYGSHHTFHLSPFLEHFACLLAALVSFLLQHGSASDDNFATLLFVGGNFEVESCADQSR